MKRFIAFAALSAFACAGAPVSGPPAEAPAPPSPAPPAAVAIELTGVASRTPELIDIHPTGARLAVRVPTARDPSSDDVSRCPYPGLPDGVDGMQLALVDFEAGSARQWTVYRTPTEADPSCTDEAAAGSALEQAKDAMQAAGLDPTQRRPWLPPAAFDDAPRQARRPASLSRTIPVPDAEALSVSLEHTSDSGYHTYTATVVGPGGSARAVHSPNPAMGGSGDLEVRGAASTEGGTVVLFEATHGPGGAWSSWMVTPPR